jgi:hypothetical protein
MSAVGDALESPSATGRIVEGMVVPYGQWLEVDNPREGHSRALGTRIAPQELRAPATDEGLLRRQAPLGFGPVGSNFGNNQARHLPTSLRRPPQGKKPPSRSARPRPRTTRMRVRPGRRSNPTAEPLSTMTAPLTTA